MPSQSQVVRFAVGTAHGRQSRAWRVWVPRNKSDLYASSRRLGGAIKVSLHEPGPARIALTREWVEENAFSAPTGKDSRLAVEWQRPRPQAPNRIARPLTIIVPWDEIRERARCETEDLTWILAPEPGMAIHFDLVYVPAGVTDSGHPGEKAMGTTLVGQVALENGQRVYITALTRPIVEPLLDRIANLRRAPILNKDGQHVNKTGLLTFSTEPNLDANDGTEVGVLVDLTREMQAPR